MYKFQEFYIPERMMGGVERYVNEGKQPGDFLAAIICNDLREAIGRADDENMRNLPAYVAYFYNKTPQGCWGSKKNMENWMKQKAKEAEGKRHE